MYNVLEILQQAQDGPSIPQGERGEFQGSGGGVQGSRDGAPVGRVLTAKEKTIHTQGLVGVLKELHDELDAAVLQAYGLTSGMTGGLTNDALLTRLVTLNAQRAVEEKAGRIRWLRPEFQNPTVLSAASADQALLNQELLPQASIRPQADLALNSPLQALAIAPAAF